MAGWFVLSKSSGKFHFNLKAGNGETILSSERYTTKASAEGGIASVKSNSSNDARYDTRTAKDGSPYFVLKAGNGEIIGTSEMYSSASARDKGIESVKANGPTAATRDET